MESFDFEASDSDASDQNNVIDYDISDAEDEVDDEREKFDQAVIIELEYEVTQKQSVLPAEVITAKGAINKVCFHIFIRCLIILILI